jgi:hypothetical protein
MTVPRKTFTIESANATLPLVRKIVDDLITLHPAWRSAVSAYELAQDGADSQAESTAAKAAREEAGRLAGEIESCRAELEQIGCLFRGFDLGLVDFPAFREGQEIVLCWQQGEPTVDHWHEVGAGFAGRQPIDASSHAEEIR